MVVIMQKFTSKQPNLQELALDSEISSKFNQQKLPQRVANLFAYRIFNCLCKFCDICFRNLQLSIKFDFETLFFCVQFIFTISCPKLLLQYVISPSLRVVDKNLH